MAIEDVREKEQRTKHGPSVAGNETQLVDIHVLRCTSPEDVRVQPDDTRANQLLTTIVSLTKQQHEAVTIS